MSKVVDTDFRVRVHGRDDPRAGDARDEYTRDKARVIHSAAFRRLQGKTQVMGVGEGDFHRTRLTHSIEVAQIGAGLVNTLQGRKLKPEIVAWLPPKSLIEAACLAHDLGHPPFGHGGEKALHERMWKCGGFEGNGQTLRILAKLEKHNERYEGINPTRRLVLAVLKYAVPYSRFPEEITSKKPPKCYFDEEQRIVEDALSALPEPDREKIKAISTKGHKPAIQHMSLDASIMEMADDIAYAVHDLEDIVARKFVSRDEIRAAVMEPFGTRKKLVGTHSTLSASVIESGVFGNWSGERKQAISALVNFFISNVELDEVKEFESPLMQFRAKHQPTISDFLEKLKTATFNLVVREAHVQQLEHRGKRIVASLFDELASAPDELIPRHAWEDLDREDHVSRRVCDYVAGMTDGYAQRIYQRLFTPGFGSSYDEL